MNKAIRRVGPAIAAVAILGGYLLISSPSASAARPLARARLHNAAGADIGSVVFKGEGTYAERVEVELELPAGAPGLGAYHGFHIHAVGACVAPFTTAGGHWNPAGVDHGDHKGDLPSVLVGLDGTAYAEFETDRFDVTELIDSDGSAVVLHEKRDNFGNVPRSTGQYEDPNGFYTSSTSKTGDAGNRYGCGVIEATA